MAPFGASIAVDGLSVQRPVTSAIKLSSKPRRTSPSSRRGVDRHIVTAHDLQRCTGIVYRNGAVQRHVDLDMGHGIRGRARSRLMAVRARVEGDTPPESQVTIMSERVTVTMDGNVAVVSIDTPPVNALSVEVLCDLLRCP